MKSGVNHSDNENESKKSSNLLLKHGDLQDLSLSGDY